MFIKNRVKKTFFFVESMSMVLGLLKSSNIHLYKGKIGKFNQLKIEFESAFKMRDTDPPGQYSSKRIRISSLSRQHIPRDADLRLRRREFERLRLRDRDFLFPRMYVYLYCFALH